MVQEQKKLQVKCKSRALGKYILETDYVFYGVRNISRIFPDFLSKQILFLQKTESILTKVCKYSVFYKKTWSVSNTFFSVGVELPVLKGLTAVSSRREFQDIVSL